LKDDDSEKREKEKKLIENYVQVNSITATPSTTGLYYISQVEGTGATPGDNDFAIIKYKGTDLDGNFFDGTDKALLELNKVTPYSLFPLGGPLKIFAGRGGFYTGVLEGMRKMKEGGKAKLIMPSILALNDYNPRIFEVELLKVISDPLAYEKTQIANYLDTASTNPTMTLADSTAKGIYFIKRATSTTSIYPAVGDSVKMKYIAQFPDGRIFDSTKEAKGGIFKFRIKDSQRDVIDGIDEGLRLMAKGDSATIVIPYTKGYGFNQRYNPYVSFTQIVMPYFSTLIFHVKLEDIVKK
jgi:FKBP-type peptidyl-prolyl cis-trans isomerase